MRNRKGAALPGAILICTFLMVVTFSVAYLVVHSATIKQIEGIQGDQHLEFESAYRHFKANNGDMSAFSSDSFVYSTLADGNVKAVIAKNKGAQMRFYAIHDFSSGKTLAYQTEDFYITVKEGHSYLGGLLLME